MKIKFLKDYTIIKSLIDPTDEVMYTVKIHGCVSGETLLETKNGKITIEEIVKNRLSIEVLSYNEEEQRCEYKMITDWSQVESAPETQWYEIQLDTGETIKITGNHKVFLPALGCYRAVQDLDGTEEFLLT